LESGRIAHELSRERVKATTRLETDVKKELDDLNMSEVKFEVAINQTPEADGIPFLMELVILLVKVAPIR